MEEKTGEKLRVLTFTEGMKRVEEDEEAVRGDEREMPRGCAGRFSVSGLWGLGVAVWIHALCFIWISKSPTLRDCPGFWDFLPYTTLLIISSRIKAQKCAPYSIPASFNYLYLLYLQVGPHLEIVLVHKSLVLHWHFFLLASLSVPLDTGPHLLKLYGTWLSAPTVKKEPELISNTPIVPTASGQPSPITSYIICRYGSKIWLEKVINVQ